MPPEYVRPYVRAQSEAYQKTIRGIVFAPNDDRDAEAIAEAATRPIMRLVELESEEQLDVQTLHRVGDRLVGERTSLTDQIRSLLPEPMSSPRAMPGCAAGSRTCWTPVRVGSVRAWYSCSVTCVSVGTNLTAALLLLTPSSRPWPGPMSEHGG